MNLEVQKRCNTLVRQNRSMFVELRGDVVAQVRHTAEVWEGDYEDPATIPGQLHCTSVRGLVIKHRQVREAAMKDLRWTSRLGQGMSALIEDRHGTALRVRKAPSEVIAEHDRLVVYPKPEQFAAAAAAEHGEEQPCLSGPVPEQPTLGPVFDAIEPIPKYRWYVLWTLSKDALHVPQVFLAAVVDIDNPSKVVVLASTPLPLAAPQEEDDDFGDFGPQEETGSGPTPA